MLSLSYIYTSECIEGLGVNLQYLRALPTFMTSVYIEGLDLVWTYLRVHVHDQREYGGVGFAVGLSVCPRT